MNQQNNNSRLIIQPHDTSQQCFKTKADIEQFVDLVKLAPILIKNVDEAEIISAVINQNEFLTEDDHIDLKLFKQSRKGDNHGTNVPEELVQSYTKYIIPDLSDTNIIDVGLRIGGFFNEAGCFNYSIKILNITEEICKKQKQNIFLLRRLLDCYHKRIYAEAIYCEFKAAEATFISAQSTIKELEKLNSVPNLAGLYTNFSLLYFIRSEYDEV
ncbi:hypothetical protein NQ314_012923 [Rhamnusium bicolor]|uniref:Uncharacterized protein n=1 Tax=Rhamnusium bicolor TaxID=1586634 RepID=A0AAV8X8H4_9CUCU|nr:hypothetical protein NQ314_012923 [Rhamnusium bicolor]